MVDAANGSTAARHPMSPADGAPSGTDTKPARRSVPRWPSAVLGLALYVLLLGANLPTPLYGLYQQRFQFSTSTLTLIFATYAAVLIPSLIVFGQLSDRVGRKRVIAAALGVAAVGLALFAAAQDTAWLFAARGAQGLAVGSASATATSALVELDPKHDPRRAALVAVVGQAGGSASGPLLAGVLAEWAPWPHVLSYLIVLAATAAVAAATLRLPEPATERGHWHLQRPSVPAAVRPRFGRAALTGASVWAVGALYLSVVPTYVGTLLAAENLALLALPSTTMLATACVAHALSLHREQSSFSSQTVGLTLLVSGLAVLVATAHVRSLGILLFAAVLAGAGLGLGFGGSQTEINRLAPQDRRGEVTAAYITIIYTGVTLVALTVGWLSDTFTISQAISVSACAIAIITGGTIAWHIRDHRAQRQRGTPSTK
jgi:MFS family permease